MHESTVTRQSIKRISVVAETHPEWHDRAPHECQSQPACAHASSMRTSVCLRDAGSGWQKSSILDDEQCSAAERWTKN